MLEGSQLKPVSDEIPLHPDGTIDTERAVEISTICSALDDEVVSQAARALPSGENQMNTSPCPVCPRLAARLATTASGGGTPAIVEVLAVGIAVWVADVAVAGGVLGAAIATGCVVMPHRR